MSETIITPGHLVYVVTITNNTGHDATGMRWGFGIDPDQGVPGGAGFETTNVIDGVTSSSSITATKCEWLLGDIEECHERERRTHTSVC